MQVTLVKKICKQCGKEFDGYYNQRYCSDECRDQYYEDHSFREQRNIVSAQSKERKREREALKRRNARKKYKGPSILEIDAAARKEGLTYGQYVAKYGI